MDSCDRCWCKAGTNFKGFLLETSEKIRGLRVTDHLGLRVTVTRAALLISSPIAEAVALVWGKGIVSSQHKNQVILKELARRKVGTVSCVALESGHAASVPRA